MQKLDTIEVASALAERGRRRLMLRLPQRRRVFAAAIDENFLDLCAAYELTWQTLGALAQPTAGEHSERLLEYQALAAEIEADAAVMTLRA